MAKGITIGGEVWPVYGPPELPIIPVLNWDDHGKKVEAGHGHNKPRVKPIDLAVWHWTGGERDPMGVFDTLRRRRLGVEFVIAARAPVIYQFADPLEVDTADAGAFNDRSVGIEIPNFGFRRLKSYWRRFDREMYEATIHGRLMKLARFRPYQLLVVRCLAEALSAALPIPRRIMESGVGNVYPTVHPERKIFTGHAGHFQLSRRKYDPGLDLLQALQTQFAGPAPERATQGAQHVT